MVGLHGTLQQHMVKRRPEEGRAGRRVQGWWLVVRGGGTNDWEVVRGNYVEK